MRASLLRRPVRELGPVFVAVVSLLLVGGLSWQLRRAANANVSLNHADDVIQETYQFERLMSDLMAGLRGYVITGSRTFLVPYESARRAIVPQLGELDTLTRDSPVQQQRVRDLRGRLGALLEFTEEVISPKAEGNGAELVRSGRGEALLANMRVTTSEMLGTEMAIHDERYEIVQRESEIAQVVAWAGMLLLGSALVMSVIERRRWREAYARSEERFRVVADQLTEYAVYLLDTDGRVASWNDGARRLTGYGPEEILGREISVFFTPEDRLQGVPRSLLERADAQGHVNHQHWRALKDGKRFWADLVLTALRDAQGRKIGYAELVRDLTRQKETEDRLRSAEAKQRAVLENASDPIVITNGRGQIEVANRRAQDVLGYSAEELAGSHLDRVLPGDGLRLDERGAPSKLPAAPLELRGRRKSGEEFPIDLSVSAPTGQGVEKSFVLIFRDVTDRRRRELQDRVMVSLGQELGQQLEVEGVMRTISHAVVPALADWAIVDLTSPSGELTRIEVVHGDARKQALARQFHDYCLRVSIASSDLRETIASGRPFLVERDGLKRLEATSADPIWLDFVRRLGVFSYGIVPLCARERTFGALSVVRSSQPFAEADLRFIEQVATRGALAADNVRLLEAATREARLREDLMAIVSHDLRNPLQAIRLNAKVMERILGAGGDQTARLRQLLGRIDSASSQGQRLISELLEEAKIESGTFSVMPGPLFVPTMVEDALQTLRPLALEKGVALETGPIAPVTVAGDQDRLIEVLSNLVGNAIKFTPSGGRITVSAVPADGAVVIAVRDTGRGISPELLPHLFDRYWQATHSERSGAGLGLSIAKGIVEAHRGRIWAESQPGQGSTFWFALPLEQPGAEAAPRP
jgi:PAS domain S-box-containing protein